MYEKCYINKIALPCLAYMLCESYCSVIIILFLTITNKMIIVDIRQQAQSHHVSDHSKPPSQQGRTVTDTGAPMTPEVYRHLLPLTPAAAAAAAAVAAATTASLSTLTPGCGCPST